MVDPISSVCLPSSCGAGAVTETVILRSLKVLSCHERGEERVTSLDTARDGEKETHLVVLGSGRPNRLGGKCSCREMHPNVLSLFSHLTPQ